MHNNLSEGENWNKLLETLAQQSVPSQNNENSLFCLVMHLPELWYRCGTDNDYKNNNNK